jgi:hypothetical protein
VAGAEWGAEQWSRSKTFKKRNSSISRLNSARLGGDWSSWDGAENRLLAYVTQLLNEPTGPTSGDSDAGKEED